MTVHVIRICAAVLVAGLPVFAAPVLAQPSSSTGGSQPASSGPVRRLSVDEAVQLALEQNLNIQVERLNPQIQDLGVSLARTAWAPTLTSALSGTGQNSPSNSFLSGGQTKVVDNFFSTTFGVRQQLATGGNYSLAWDSSRSTTTNIFSNFNPILRSNLSASFVQPLLRNFKVDGTRQQLLISKKNREISDVTLRQTVVQTIRSVKSGYWDLAYAISSLAVQQRSLDLARESLRNTRTRVEIGTMAPIDIVEAESEVAQREEAVIVAEAAIRQAEDRLRALIYDPSTPSFWDIRIEPTEAAAFQPLVIDIDAAIRNAMDKRTDLQQLRKNLETSDINIRYYRNQVLPDVNLSVDYGLAALGGTQLIRGPGFPGEVVGQTQRTYGTVLKDILQNDFPTWTVALTVGYPIGTSQAEASLARARLQHSQGQVQLRNLELQVTAQVRDVARQAVTNAKRVEATRAARELAARRLEAEQKKFTVGTTTSFQVFQAQRDLAQARNNELRAVLDYSRSLVDFESVQEAALSGGGISLASDVGAAASLPADQTSALQTGSSSSAAARRR